MWKGVPWGTVAADGDRQRFHSSSENGCGAGEGFGTGEGAQRMDYAGRQLLSIHFKLAEAGRNCLSLCGNLSMQGCWLSTDGPCSETSCLRFG